MRTIVLTGGGTAGHVLPQMALLPYLRPIYDQIVYIGGVGVEKSIVTQNGLPYREITTVKLRRTLTLKNLLIPFKLWKGIREAKKILREIKPDVVFSKGSFVALPVVMAASSLGIKVVAHESDMSLGLANRLTAKKCQTLCTTFPLDKSKYPNMVQTGAIIRQSIYQGDPKQIKLPANGKPNLLVIGGSLGAAAINQVIWASLTDLCQRWNVLHVTGKGKSN
ncbi:MAG: glycosyltransferase, partial [Clostridia bacterium]|nr:glycosyltransferase [Clostridia bacterium]